MKITIDSSSKRRIDDNGFMYVEGCRISKACINPYLGNEIADFASYGLEPHRIYQVYRKAEELQNAAPTFNGMPLLLGHHDESAAAPQKMHRVGSLGTDCRFDFPYLVATLIITDQKAIDAVESGEAVEISCGYMFEPVLESGVFENEKYDFYMQNIRANHVALVPEGRAGKDVRVADRALCGAGRVTAPQGSNPKTSGDSLPAQATLATACVAQDVQPSVIETDVRVADARFFNAKDLENYDGTYDPRQNTVTQGKTMNRLQKMRLALDEAKKELKILKDEGMEGEAIEQAESDVAKAALAIQRIEAESEGKSPEEFDINEDAGMLDAMKACDIDAENPEFRKAFSEGVKYGEKLEKNPAERKKLDSEHESEGEKKAEDAEPASEGEKKAMPPTKDAKPKPPSPVSDAATMARDIAQNVERQMREKHEAAQAVQPLVGKIVDPFAFDSAQAIYLHACKVKGVSATADSAKDVCAVLRSQVTKNYTADAAPAVHNALAAIGLGE